MVEWLPQKLGGLDTSGVEVMCWPHGHVVASAGLSSESWSIMKNMATELGIILIGYFTLVPAIQVGPQACCVVVSPMPGPAMWLSAG